VLGEIGLEDSQHAGTGRTFVSGTYCRKRRS
jgi:hypothetical protein